MADPDEPGGNEEEHSDGESGCDLLCAQSVLPLLVVSKLICAGMLALGAGAVTPRRGIALLSFVKTAMIDCDVLMSHGRAGELDHKISSREKSKRIVNFPLYP